jgi:Raf kinase inhibitor-like YbhB/YbcL family protein
MTTLKVMSPGFGFGQMIPVKYTCDGANVSPPLHIENVPGETNSLAIIMDDPDAPSRTWNHWLVWNIPFTNDIAENDPVGVVGLNDFRRNRYNGPCPTSGTHRFYFKIYALNTELNLKISTKKKKLLMEMRRYVIAKGELVGIYKRL